MNARSLVLISGFCGLSWVFPAAADEGPRLIPNVEGHVPAIAATDDGFGLAWWDWADQGETHPYGAARFQRLDETGAPVGVSTRLSIDPPWLGPVDTGTELIAVPGGFVYIGHFGGEAVLTAGLDAAGNQLGPSHMSVDSEELYMSSAARGASGILLAYPEWWGSFLVRNRAVGKDGAPRGWPILIGTPGIGEGGTPGDAFVNDASVACENNTCVVAWARYGSGIELRDVDSSGRPLGPRVELGFGAEFHDAVAIAATGGVQAIVYATGEDLKDLFLVTRHRDGSLRGPYTLSADPFEEGVRAPFEEWFNRGLRVVAGDGRIAVFWLRTDPVYPWGDWRWIFREFDLEGRPLGARRDLRAEFGMLTVTQPDVKWDEAHDRYVIVWDGEGPEGWGMYWLAVDAAP